MIRSWARVPRSGSSRKCTTPIWAGEWQAKLIVLGSTDVGRVQIQLAFRTDREGDFRVPAPKGTYKLWAARAAESGHNEQVPLHSEGTARAVLPLVVDFNSYPQGANPRLELSISDLPGGRDPGTVTGRDGKQALDVGLVLWRRSERSTEA